MRPLSLRWRLFLAGGAAILLALGLAVMGLATLFERHVERVAVTNLEARAGPLIAMVEPVDGGAPILHSPPPDPLYDRPLSGHYWQLRLGDRLTRSRSLWDAALPELRAPLAPGTQRVLTLEGPRGAPLLAIERHLLVGRGADAVPLTLLVASERQELTEARRAFFYDLLPYVALLASLLLAAFWAQIVIGLRPLSHMAARIDDLSRGRRARLGGDLPAEVMPLATQLDRLLDDRDREMTRARHRAADLAHGFKTPLQALMGDAEELRRMNHDRIAHNVETVATTMQRLVDRELTRARIQSDRTIATADVSAVLAKIAGVLRRVPAGAALNWQLDAAPEVRARIDGDDLTEALGALMENAMRHARSHVWIRVVSEDGIVEICIRDDGPGIPPDALSRLMRRGERLDEAEGGHGIGLAVVSEIVEAAGGTLDMSNAEPGLLVCLRLQHAP